MIKKIISMGLLFGLVILAFVISRDSELLHNKKHLIETNFVQLEIDKYSLFEKIFLIAYNEKNSIKKFMELIETAEIYIK